MSAGAREVHMRISCPPTISPCFYGVDTPRRSELIAATHTLEEIRKYLNADSVAYLSLDGLTGAVRGGDSNYCTSCYTGVYPVAFPRDEAAYLQLALKLNPEPARPADQPMSIAGLRQRSRRRLMDYKAAGVDIDAGNETVRRIRGLARSTFTSGVLSDIGSFGGLFQLESGRYREPVLVASADGVGTKLKVAFLAGRHDTVGIDLVNHCVNDILVQGAEPLFFLDYLATGQLSPAVAESIVGGMAAACRDNSCALLGGETAEMPGFYADGEYDLAGFIVGVVDRERLINGRDDCRRRRARRCAVVGPAYQRVFAGPAHRLRSTWARLSTATCRSSVARSARRCSSRIARTCRFVQPLLDGGRIKGMAHITGGGITDNLPRVLPHGTAAVVDVSAWEVPPIFTWLQRNGQVPIDDMMRTFNMGVGLDHRDRARPGRGADRGAGRARWP